jgi:hypothetical protein
VSVCLNFSGGGVHEVAAMRKDGVLVAGHFDDLQLADVAIAELDEYRAVYSSLNRVGALPLGRVLNPHRLTRGSRIGAENVERRTGLLLDFEDHTGRDTKAPWTQAYECRKWLHDEQRWPVLSLCDTGRFPHLRGFMHLPASAEVKQLIRRALAGLKQRYSTLDAGMFDAPRVCRYYGTLHAVTGRTSGVLEVGERVPITASQLNALSELMQVPVIQPSGDGIARPDSQDKFVRRFTTYCERIGLRVSTIRTLGNRTVFVQTEFCLLNEDHKGSSCGVGVALDGVRQNLCKHAGCAMPWSQWSRAVEQKFGQPMLLDGVIQWKK